MRLLVTVEHASNRIPEQYANLGLSREELGSHAAWDPGALDLGHALSERFAAPLLQGEWSRLLVDLNRSESNRRIVPERSFGLDIPGNRGLSRQQTIERIGAFWRPFRQAAHSTIAEQGSFCLHLSVHTFTPRLADETRNFDLAVLYDPRRERERVIAGELVRFWRFAGCAARRNAPYRGVADGHTTALRREFTGVRYAGLEIEVNQRLLPDWQRMTAAVVEAIQNVMEKQKARL